MAKVESTLSLGGSGSTPNLQQVTDVGNTTTNDIILDGTFKKVKSTDGKKYFEVGDTYARIIALEGTLPFPDTEARIEVQTNGAVLIQGESAQINIKDASITGQDLTFRGLEYSTDNSDNFTDRSLVDKGYVDGELIQKADLVGGVIPEAQLPSYVDDVLEVVNYASLPISGVSGKIYVTLDNNKTYRWSGSVYVELSSPQVPTVLGLIKIVDKIGNFFTNLTTASAYIRNFTSATITNESFSNGTFWFTVPNGSSFANASFFLSNPAAFRSAYIEDTLGLITTFGGVAFYKNTGNNILGNCTFGSSAFESSTGNNTLGNCTFDQYSFQYASSNNTMGNCTFVSGAFQLSSGNNKIHNLLLSQSLIDIFANQSTGRFEIYGTIGTTVGNNYPSFFPNSTAVIWAQKSMQTNNAGGIEGDLARAQTNGAKLFFGYADGGATDLSYTASPTNGIVTSSTGTDATIPLADGTNAGLILLDSFGDVIVDNDFITAPTIGTITQPTLIVDTASVVLNGLPSSDWVINETPTTAGLTGLTGSTSTTTITGLTNDTTYTFKVTSNGETSVDSADVVIDPQPMPTEYFVRPLGTIYGDSSGVNYANAWTGFSGINWVVLDTKTLNVVGTHNEELNVQSDSVTIVGNHVSGAGIIDAQNTRVCFRINGYDNITVNNLTMKNGLVSNAFNMLTTGTVYNNCIFDTSGNQTAQHEGNVISDIISVTYNNCTFKNGADDGVSLHGDNTTVVLNNCSMENNSQGVNAINTGICIINDSNFLNNTTDLQPDSSSDITVNRSTFRSQLSANSTVPMKLNNCTMLSGETVITSLGSATISDTKYIGASKITSNQTDITKVIITRCYFEVNAIAKVTTINNGVYNLTYSTFKHFSGTNVYSASTGGTGTSTINNCNFIGVTSTGRGIAAGGRVNVKNTIFQGLNLCVNPNGANAIVTFEKCCTYLNTTINVNQNGGTFTNTSSVTTNPLFTDLPNLDFRLTTGSSCWNTGLTLTNSTGILSANWSTGMPTVTTKTQASTWDIGAYIH
jgi:hypothetical protein